MTEPPADGHDITRIDQLACVRRAQAMERRIRQVHSDREITPSSTGRNTGEWDTTEIREGIIESLLAPNFIRPSS